MGGREQEAFTLRTGITPGDIRRLGKVPLFTGFIPDDLRKLLATSSIRHYPDQTTLFMEGEPAQRFFVVMEGWIKLYRLCEDGHEVVISVVSPGESFAEAAIFDNRVYPVSSMTITDTRLLVVSAEAMLRELHDNMSFTFNMLSSMSRHLRKSITLVHQLSALSSTERLADFLLSLCDAVQGEVCLTLPHDKSLIAARLGMQPETFSRALAKLKAAGVSNSGHDVVIQNIDALRDYIKHKSMGCG
ncbi:MAG: Crp/Fnr family transcriptional regulator [Rhodospirillales bacterium]|nr:Crp/Fnr family transcriptional regulator [Rhodospirillales bacterium]